MRREHVTLIVTLRLLMRREHFTLIVIHTVHEKGARYLHSDTQKKGILHLNSDSHCS